MREGADRLSAFHCLLILRFGALASFVLRFPKNNEVGTMPTPSKKNYRKITLCEWFPSSQEIPLHSLHL